MEYVWIILLILAIGGVAIFYAYTQPKKIKEWLIYACAYAELALGSGTGALKLRQVYNMFIEKFPFMAKIISFAKFKEWTEEALANFKEYLETNPKADEFFSSKEEF